jgi:acyl-coenzyme A synthetase/AMP-(fatty) acid ligase
MGDVGYLDEKGRIWMCGRKDHRVETDHGTLFTIPCEAVFNTHPAVRRSALVGVARSGHVEPVLCVERAPGHDIRPGALMRELLDIAKQHDHTSRIETMLYHDCFPVDVRHNAKIFREKLAVWAQEQSR